MLTRHQFVTPERPAVMAGRATAARKPAVVVGKRKFTAAQDEADRATLADRNRRIDARLKDLHAELDALSQEKASNQLLIASIDGICPHCA
jgi:cell division protein FtsB